MRRRVPEHLDSEDCPCCERMREELCGALMQALYELDVLPENEEGALVGVYAVMDDLRSALDRTECLDAKASA